MSQTLPPSRLTDVLRRNSMETLKRHAAELASASSMMPAEAMQTRFLRNHFLINPKSLHLMSDEEILSRYHLFAVYKPPFCPMRRSEAHENYHRVSMESFVTAALKSQTVFPVMTRSIAPKEVHVRVLNDVDVFASGPVIVSVADKYPHATSLDGFVFEYDVMVAGHILQTTSGGGKGPQPIPASALFPDDVAVADGSDAVPTLEGEGATGAGPSNTCTCTFEVVQHAYYSVHPVSLLNVKIVSPPTPRPPNIDGFVRDHLDTCVIGDPVAMGDFVAATTGQQRPKRGPSSAVSSSSSPSDAEGAAMRGAVKEEPVAPLMKSHIVSMRGDCDFPRVFTHLREVHFDVALRDVHGDVIGDKQLSFHCRKCFDSILQKTRSFSLKANRINLLDGTWTPASEYM